MKHMMLPKRLINIFTACEYVLYTVGIWAYYMAKNSYKDLKAFLTPPKYADQKNLKEKNIPLAFWGQHYLGQK